jgi:hypothetical protein
MGVQPGQQFCRSLVAQLLIYAAVFGNEAAQTALQDMSTYLSNTVSRRDVRWLKGCYSVNQAFEEYRQGQYFQVIARALQATIYDPTYLTNRGVVAIFLRSLFNLLEVDLQSRFRSSTLSQKL